MSVHRLRYRNDIIPRDLVCPVCKNEIEDASHVLFSSRVKHNYEDCRKDVSWFSTHFFFFLLLLLVISRINVWPLLIFTAADDKGTIREMSCFSTKCCNGETVCNFATDTYNRCKWWTPDELIISLTNRWSERVYGDSLTWRVHVAYWLTDGLKDQLAIHTLIDRRPDRCIPWLISWLIVWIYHLIDRPTDTSRQWVPNEYKLVTDWTSETVTWRTNGLLYV